MQEIIVSAQGDWVKEWSVIVVDDMQIGGHKWMQNLFIFRKSGYSGGSVALFCDTLKSWWKCERRRSIDFGHLKLLDYLLWVFMQISLKS